MNELVMVGVWLALGYVGAHAYIWGVVWEGCRVNEGDRLHALSLVVCGPFGFFYGTQRVIGVPLYGHPRASAILAFTLPGQNEWPEPAAVPSPEREEKQ